MLRKVYFGNNKMTNLYKMVLKVFILFALFASLGCVKTIELIGSYISENGLYEIVFVDKVNCIWKENERTYKGTYKGNGSKLTIEITGDEFIGDNSFIAKKEGDFLVLYGGDINGERFMPEEQYYTYVKDRAVKRLSCESADGEIVIDYDERSLIDFISNGIDYDYYSQKVFAENVGVIQYIENFAESFEDNTGGSCRWGNAE